MKYIKQVKDGEWRKLEFALNQAREIMKKEGWSELPNSNTLSQNGYSSLVRAINIYHDGFHNFRNKLGERQKEREKGIWKSLEYTLQQAREIMQKENWDELPGQKILLEKKYSSLASSISKYHGWTKVREALGGKQKRVQDGSWKSLEFTLNQAKDIMQKEGWKELPSQKELHKRRYSGFVVGVSRNHGLRKIRALMGQKQLRRLNGCYETVEQLVDEAKKIMNKNGFDVLPSPNKLWGLGYSSFVSAVSKKVGFPKFRKLLGQNKIKKEMGYWKSIENCLCEAKKIVLENNFEILPGNKTLMKLGFGTFVTSVTKYHGGMRKFKDKLAEFLEGKSEKEKLEEVLEKYLEN